MKLVLYGNTVDASEHSSDNKRPKLIKELDFPSEPSRNWCADEPVC